jgi:hypothetical protein
MFKRNKERTPKQKAEKAQMNILVRLIGCGWIIWIVIKLFRDPEIDVFSQPVWQLILLGVMILAAAVIIPLTVLDFIRNFKAGYYSQKAYIDPSEVIESDEESGDNLLDKPAAGDDEDDVDDAGDDADYRMSAHTEKQEARYMIEDEDGFILTLTESQLEAYQNGKNQPELPKSSEERIKALLFEKLSGKKPDYEDEVEDAETEFDAEEAPDSDDADDGDVEPEDASDED